MKEIKEATKWAFEMTDGLPEAYKVVAFQELLRYRLSRAKPVAGQHRVATSTVDRGKTFNPKVGWISDVLAVLPADHSIRERGSEEQKVAWAVINLANQGESAINKTIREFIRFNLGIAPPSRQNTNRALRGLFPKHLSRERVEEEKSYEYTPKPTIKEIFEKLS